MNTGRVRVVHRDGGGRCIRGRDSEKVRENCLL